MVVKSQAGKVTTTSLIGVGPVMVIEYLFSVRSVTVQVTVTWERGEGGGEERERGREERGRRGEEGEGGRREESRKEGNGKMGKIHR